MPYSAPVQAVDLPPHVKHGTPNAYSWYGCRCLDCKTDQGLRSREYRLRNPERFRRQRREEYARNPQRFIKHTKMSADRRARILGRYKQMKGCLRCGYRENHLALEFHHRDPAEKEFTVSVGKGRAWKAVKAEIAKCDVLCANCHRITTWEIRWGI